MKIKVGEMKCRKLIKTRWQCKSALFASQEVNVCVCPGLNGFCSILGMPPRGVWSDLREFTCQGIPVLNAYASEGEITDITLKKCVQSNRAYHYMLYVSMQSESINNTVYCREIPLTHFINSCLKGVVKTHTDNIEYSKFYCKLYILQIAKAAF